MYKSQLRVINAERIHPRELAKQAIKARTQYPRVNQHDSGAPALQVDDVLKKADTDHLGKK